MTNKSSTGPRKERLAEALRANLRRRKAQERARETDPDATDLAYRPEPVGTIRIKQETETP